MMGIEARTSWRLRTLEEALDLGEFRGIVELPKVLGLLGQFFALDGRVPLVAGDVRCRVVELRGEIGEVDVWKSQRA